MMVSEIGQAGDWTRAFEVPHMDKFDAPTVEGVDFPALGIRQAWNDVEGGTLYVGTYASTPDRRGVETSWRVTNLPNPDDVLVICDGQPFQRFEAEGSGTIRIDTDIDSHQFHIFTGYRGRAAPTRDAGRETPGTSGSAALVLAERPTRSTAGGARGATSEFIPDRNPGYPDRSPGCTCC